MALLIDILLVTGLVALIASLSVTFGPERVLEGERGLPYETGLPPLETAFKPTSVLYVRYALLFVVFDVELAFLLPAVNLGTLDAGIMAALTVFVGLLALMLGYVWRKGALECS